MAIPIKYNIRSVMVHRTGTLMAVLSVALILVPFIPGLRDIPRWIPIHRLIWKRFYAEQRAGRS